jgi:hypothetical protein
LNNNGESPIRKMIKLLGRGNGLFSQAFFVRKMQIHFNEGGVWREIYLDYLASGTKYKELPQFMKIYLRSIKEVYSKYWPEMIEKNGEQVYNIYNRDFPYDYILCRPTGIGAFFKLINEFYPLVKKLSEQKMEEKIKKILEKIPKEKSKKLFSNIDGPYMKSSSEGIVSRLYKELKELYGFK